jgi:hypothetical protein
MKIVEEARFGGEGADGNDALEELAEIGEDGGTRVDEQSSNCGRD